MCPADRSSGVISPGGIRVVRDLAEVNDTAEDGLGSILRDPAHVVGVTIGNFDGFHLGHQALIGALDDALEADAEATGRIPISSLMTFAPHPRAVLGGIGRSARRLESAFASLTSVREKIEQAELLGIDLAFIVRFTPAFASLSPEEFFLRYIVEGLRAEIVVVGDDWSFGKGRTGSTETLTALGEKYGVQALIQPEVGLEGERVSSSAVKEALQRGDVKHAAQLLGRPFSVSGRVRHGEKLGRTIGVRTANLHLAEQLLPADGVYACTVQLGGGAGAARMPAVVNIGMRPTVGGKARTVEAHLLDGELDLYGSRLRLAFIERIREERRFSGLEELRAAIQEDIRTAKTILAGKLPG